jgi:N-acetylglutamate synthase-like GNAT family acetyltransferase
MLRPLLGRPAGPEAGSDGSYDMRGGCEGCIQREVGSLAVPDQLGTYSFRSAEAADASRVAELVAAAYGHYVERIGMLAGPMTADYAEVIRNRQVTVAERHGAIVGVIVLTVTGEGFLVDNVAVHPSHRGTGLGRALLELAEEEARRAGFDSLYLFTHEQMTENLALYKDRVRRVRPTLPRRVLTCLPAQAPRMSLPLGPLGPSRGGQDPGPQRRGRRQKITVDRRVAGAIEALEFLAGTGAPARWSWWPSRWAPDRGGLGEAPARPTGGIWGPGTRTWPGRSEPTCLRRTWTAGCPSRGWRSALPQRQGGSVGGC